MQPCNPISNAAWCSTPFHWMLRLSLGYGGPRQVPFLLLKQRMMRPITHATLQQQAVRATLDRSRKEAFEERMMGKPCVATRQVLTSTATRFQPYIRPRSGYWAHARIHTRLQRRRFMRRSMEGLQSLHGGFGPMNKLVTSALAGWNGCRRAGPAKGRGKEGGS
jgi:hypothetical protein